MKLAVAKVRNFSLLRMLFEYFYDTFRLINIAKERLRIFSKIHFLPEKFARLTKIQ